MTKPVFKATLSVVAAAAVLTLGISAQAQSRPTDTSSAAVPRAGTPFWGNEAGQMNGRQPRPAYDHDYDRDKEDTFAEKFPTGLAGRVAPAHERVTGLRWTYWTAKDQLGDRIRHLRNAFESSEEYQQLTRQRDEALAALDQARKAALAPLQNDPEYQALIELQDKLQQQIKQAHAALSQFEGDQGRDQAPPEAQQLLDEIQAKSRLAFSYAQQQYAMEEPLLSGSQAIAQAREHVHEIGQSLAEMDDEFEHRLRNDEQLAQLRDRIDQLRVGYLAAGAYYDSAVRTANIATDFAYFDSAASSRFGRYGNPYGYGYPWYGNPYGFGGGFIIAGPIVVGNRPLTPPAVQVSPITNTVHGGPSHTFSTPQIGVSPK